MRNELSPAGKRVAVIGGGISGMAVAYYLSRRHMVWLFEKEPRLGGSTHFATIFNRAADTNLAKLLGELGVSVQPCAMSMSVFSPSDGFEYSSRGAAGFFARWRNLASPAHYRLLADIRRFRLLTPGAAAGLTLAAYLNREGFDPAFHQRFLYPLASAIWRMPMDSIGGFPAVTLIRYVAPLLKHPAEWRMVAGGVATCAAELTAPYRDRVVTQARIAAVARGESGVTLSFEDRAAMAFDEVVLGVPGDCVLPLLANPLGAEKDVFRGFTTSRNGVLLHTDATLIPRRRLARAAVNYLLRPDGGGAVTYDLSRLQDGPARYLTINGADLIGEGKVIDKFVHAYPRLTPEAVAAQGRWGEVSGRGRIHYCGAYWIYGFMEDGVKSAMRVARALGVGC